MSPPVTQWRRVNSSAGSVDLVTVSEAVKYEGTTLTGYYEGVTPSTANPSTITLLGRTLEVDSSALSSLSLFKVGERITVVLNGAGEVTYACSPSERTAQMVGLVTSTGTTCQVELFNGLTVSGALAGGSVSVGDLVRVTASAIGKLSLSSISTGAVSGSLNLTTRTLGSVALADNVVLYDRGGNSKAVRVELDDVLACHCARLPDFLRRNRRAGESESDRPKRRTRRRLYLWYSPHRYQN